MLVRVTALMITLLLVASALPAAAESGDQTVRFSARVVDTMGSVPGKSSARVKMEVDSWSADDEIIRLVNLLNSEGDRALYQALRDMEKVGWLSVGSGLAQNIVVARSVADGEGRVVRLLLNRPITFFEAVRGLRLEDYPFGFVELRLDKDGTGEGQLYAAARIRVTEQGLSIESYGVKPLRLMGVKLK